MVLASSSVGPVIRVHQHDVIFLFIIIHNSIFNNKCRCGGGGVLYSNASLELFFQRTFFQAGFWLLH